MNEIWQTVLAIFASIGGAGVLISFIVKFTADKIATRLETRYEQKLNKELETHKSQLEKQNNISRAMFDKEFSIYQDLINKFYEAFSHMEILHGIESTNQKIIKVSDLKIDAFTDLSTKPK